MNAGASMSKPTPRPGTRDVTTGSKYGKGWVKNGYRFLPVRENGRARHKQEHRIVMGHHLGRKLEPDEIVHHKNGDTLDNNLENLEVTTHALHMAEHHKGSWRDRQTKQTLAVLARYRQDLAHLRLVNEELVAALEYALCAPIWPCDCAPDHFGDRAWCPQCVVKSTIDAALAKAEGRGE